MTDSTTTLKSLIIDPSSSSEEDPSSSEESASKENSSASSEGSFEESSLSSFFSTDNRKFYVMYSPDDGYTSPILFRGEKYSDVQRFALVEGYDNYRYKFDEKKYSTDEYVAHNIISKTRDKELKRVYTLYRDFLKECTSGKFPFDEAEDLSGEGAYPDLDRFKLTKEEKRKIEEYLLTLSDLEIEKLTYLFEGMILKEVDLVDVV